MIDPPYNTGNDILYKNDYSTTQDEYDENMEIDDYGNRMFINTDSNGRFHSDWCSMMYQRLLLSRNLLNDNGVIVIAIDHYELAQLIEICDEVFSYSNRLGIVTVVHKPEGRNQEKFFATSNEYALFYAKDITKCKFNSVILTDEKRKEFDLSDEKGYYKLDSLIAKNHGRNGEDRNLRIHRPHKFYPIFVNPETLSISLSMHENAVEVLPITREERTWKYDKNTMAQKISENEIVARVKDGKISLFDKYRAEKGELIKTHWIRKEYNANFGGTKVLEKLMQCKSFDFPKSLYLMEDIIKILTKEDDLIMDFFSGSATTAHAIMSVNATDSGKRRFILVQIPAECAIDTDAYKSGFNTICDIAKERIRRAGEKIKEENPLCAQNLDTGFRVLKLDDSNMNDVYYSPAEYSQDLLSMLESNVKPDRTDLDLLFGCLLEWGLPLSLHYSSEEIEGFTVHNYNDGDLITCFDENIPDSVLKDIAKKRPLRAVFRDSSFADSPTKINVGEMFKLLAPDTRVKVI